MDSYMHVFQIDYSNRLSKKHLIEAGGKADLSHDANLNENLYGTSAADAVIDESQSVDVSQFRDIYALYGSYTGTFSSFNVKAGLRYEHTRMGLKYKTQGRPDFTTRLNDVVPNLSFSYNFTTASNLRMAYQLRISRPGIFILNPYVNTFSPGEISYGNPDLKSMKNHNISLSYGNYDHKLSGSIKATYMYMDNDISSIVFVKDNQLNRTYANIGINQSLTFNIDANWNISRDLRVILYLNAEYSHISADSELLKQKAVGWYFYVGPQVNYTFPFKMRLSAYGGYSSPWISIQTKGASSYNYGLSLSRSFLKEDALTLALSASNILPAIRKYSYTVEGESVRTTTTNHTSQWYVGFSISYRFGGLKAGVKSTAASVSSEGAAGASR